MGLSMNDNRAQERYIPALAYRWLTPLYDPVVRWTTRERTFKPALLQQAELRPGDRVLDLACGTGTLTILAKQLYPSITIMGLDGDAAVLGKAREKARFAGVAVNFELALAQQIPFPDSSLDIVLSSLFFHHLTRESKLAVLREVLRVLKPAGELHVADWGRAANPLMRLLFYFVQLLDGFANTTDNVAGRLPDLMRAAGFAAVSEQRRFATPLGTISLYAAIKAA